MGRVLAIFLDGYEQSLGRRLMAAGEMPELSRLADSSARFLLDHGPAKRTGLAAEHVATGLSPEAAQRWNCLHFDPRSYRTWQEGTRLQPFPAGLKCRTVVFDMPYFDLNAAPKVRGLVSWGAHNPGVAKASRPSDLIAEFTDRFGTYPAPQWIYGFAWPSVDNCRRMGSELARAVHLRAEAARWLLGKRLPDWDLALVAVGEPHSVIEGLWHGIDATHPLHYLPSAGPAAAGIRDVYQSVDRLVGKLTAEFPDAVPIVFTMDGMGVNGSDVTSMLLLPELMYRHAFGSTYFMQPREWGFSPTECPMPPSRVDSWEALIAARFPPVADRRFRRFAGRLLPEPIKSRVRSVFTSSDAEGHPVRSSLAWMPATRYQRFWHSMPAFALPSFSDGRIRLNLIGRELHGKVSLENYQRAVATIENLIRACIDPATGESAVDFVEYPAQGDPCKFTSTQADLIVVWKGAATCLAHPSLGRIGPVPYRRTGGHTGRFGMAYIGARTGLAGDQGIRSAFDVVPTIIQLLGHRPDRPFNGTSLLSDPQSDDDARALGAVSAG